MKYLVPQDTHGFSDELRNQLIESLGFDLTAKTKEIEDEEDSYLIESEDGFFLVQDGKVYLLTDEEVNDITESHDMIDLEENERASLEEAFNDMEPVENVEGDDEDSLDVDAIYECDGSLYAVSDSVHVIDDEFYIVGTELDTTDLSESEVENLYINDITIDGTDFDLEDVFEDGVDGQVYIKLERRSEEPDNDEVDAIMGKPKKGKGGITPIGARSKSQIAKSGAKKAKSDAKKDSDDE